MSEPACNAFHTITPRYFHAWLQAGLRAHELADTPNLPPSHDEYHHSGCWADFSRLPLRGQHRNCFVKNETHLFPSFTRISEKKVGHLTTCSDYKLFISCPAKNYFS